MKHVAILLNQMLENGVIADYALFGAAAQMRYTEAVATFDADILVAVPSPDRIDVLTPIYEFCAAHGYHPDGEAIKVGSWPVQFMPAFSHLAEVAMKEADSADYEGIPFRVVRAEHLALLALAAGRSKDFLRILSLLESKSVTRKAIEALAPTFDLGDAWLRFKSRFLDE